ncbi:MAG TPA: nucleotidyltransferase family protein [Pyrinomonadaceae bacterium]|jgi:molybdenum cofactor cytidylyltransferase
MNKKPEDSKFTTRRNPQTGTRNIKVGLILPAAGASKRLGNFPKQLLEFRGKTLIRRAAENALASECGKICVVLGASAGKIKREIDDLPIEIAVNEDWVNGMSSSLKSGLGKLLEIEPELSAAVVMLADQPLIDSTIINRLIEVFLETQAPIVASRYAETVGVPAIFARSMFDELMSLTNDGGAKLIIKKYAAAVEKVRVPEAAFDVDTPQDYENLLKLK